MPDARVCNAFTARHNPCLRGRKFSQSSSLSRAIKATIKHFDRWLVCQRCPARSASKGLGSVKRTFFEGFDPGSERTLAAWMRHASRTRTPGQLGGKVAKGAVRRG